MNIVVWLLFLQTLQSSLKLRKQPTKSARLCRMCSHRKKFNASHDDQLTCMSIRQLASIVSESADLFNRRCGLQSLSLFAEADSIDRKVGNTLSSAWSSSKRARFQREIEHISLSTLSSTSSSQSRPSLQPLLDRTR